MSNGRGSGRKRHAESRLQGLGMTAVARIRRLVSTGRSLMLAGLVGVSTATLGLALSLAAAPAQARPSGCGHESQRACNVWEWLPSCAPGLVERPFGRCVKATPSVVEQAIRSAAALTKAEIDKGAQTAASTFNKAVRDTESAYKKTVAGLQSAEAKWSQGAQDAVRQFNGSLTRLGSRMQSLDASALAALNRTVRAIPTGTLDEQARQDMRLLAEKLSLLPGQADALFPNVRDSIFGVFVQRSVAVGVGVSENYAFVMGTREVDNVLPVGIVYTVGGSAGPQNIGVSNQIGIMWQPGSIDNAGGGNVGVGVDFSKASVGVSWNVAAGMEKEGPKGAIPGFALAFSHSCCSDPVKFSTSVAGGYATLVKKWQGDPIVADWGYLYGVDPGGSLLYWRLDGNGKVGASGRMPGGGGWGSMRVITAGNNGEIFAVHQNGDLYFYKHDGNLNWVSGSGRKVGNGWGAMKSVFAGGTDTDGTRVLYAIDGNGTLKLYRFSRSDASHTGTQDIGWGWNFARVFAGGNGAVYGIKTTGELVRYQFNLNRVSGTPRPHQVGTGWAGFKHVFAGPSGAIYAVASDDRLLYYRDLGDAGVAGPQPIGHGWGAISRATGMLRW